MAIINRYDATKSYTAMMLQVFSKLELLINQTDLYNIQIVFGGASRLKKKLANIQENTFSYRTPIMSLDVGITNAGLERATNRLLKRRVLNIDAESVAVKYNDTPTDFEFKLTILADDFSTLSNIVEGIRGLFHNNVTYKDYKSPLGDIIRTPIIIDNIVADIENNEDVFENDRLLQAEFDLRVEGVIHSQFESNVKKITRIDMLIDDYTIDINNIIEQYTIQ